MFADLEKQYDYVLHKQTILELSTKGVKTQTKQKQTKQK